MSRGLGMPLLKNKWGRGTLVQSTLRLSQVCYYQSFPDTVLLSEEAISRGNMYPDRL